MKKSLLVSLILLTGVLLTACGKKSEENLENIEPVAEITNKDCQTAIDKYLDSSNKEGEGSEIKEGDNIVVDYIGRLEDGTVFDTSIKTIAEACGTYTEARDYTEGLSFQAGVGQMVKGFDDAVIGMKIGQTKTVKFGPEEGYGEYKKEYVITYTQDEIGDLSVYNVGDYFQANPYTIGKITEINDKEMIVDFNSELAGKTLIFDITVKENFGKEDNTNNELPQEEVVETTEKVNE